MPAPDRRIAARGAWIAWGLLILAALAFGIFLGPFTRTGYYVCRECGALRHTREKQLPRLDVTWWLTQRIEETPLSRLVRESGYAEPHDHLWVRGELSGNGRSFGSGGGLEMRKDAESRHVVAFLRHLVYQGNRERFLEWKTLALAADPKGRRLEKALRDAGFPVEGFADAATFDHWFQAWR